MNLPQPTDGLIGNRMEVIPMPLSLSKKSKARQIARKLSKGGLKSKQKKTLVHEWAKAVKQEFLSGVVSK